MKVALVFHGLSYGYNNKGEYSSITQDSFDSIKKRILNKKIYEYTRLKTLVKPYSNLLEPR